MKNEDQLLTEIKKLRSKIAELEKTVSEQAKEESIAAYQQLQAANQQLDASNQQLTASEQQLKAANQQLISSEQEIKKYVHDLRERVKELDCLYKISESVKNNDAIEDVLQDIANLIPLSWHYPEITRGKVSLDGKKFVSKTFKKTKWKQSADIIIDDKIRGAVEVYYLEERPELDEGPFMKEERKLIDGIAKTLSEVIEGKQVEEALRESEKQYRLIAENTSDNIGITTFDLKAKYIYVSPSVEPILGYESEDLLGKSFFDFIHPKDKKVLFPLLKDYVNQKIKKILTGKELPVSRTIDFRFRNKAGNWRFMQSTVNIAGKHLIAVTRDITERKLAEEELGKQKDYLEKAQQIGQIGTWEYNIDTDSTYWTDEMYKIFGVPLGTKISLELFFDCVHPDDRDKVQKTYSEAFETKIHDLEFRIIHNKKVKWVKEKANYIIDETGSVTRVIGVTQDITERKRSEDKIKESEEKLRNFVDYTPLGVWCFQPIKPVSINIAKDQIIDEFFNSICIECNDTYANMMGISSKEILGLKLSDAMPDNEENRDYLRTFINNGYKLSGSISKEITGDGEEKYFSNSMIGVIKDGKLINAWGTQSDVTEQKQAEEALKENEQNLRTLFNAMSDIVFEMDYDGRYINIAPTSPELMFKPSDDVIGKTLHEVFPKPEADIFLEFIRKSLDENKTTSLKYPMTINNKTHWFEGKASPKTKNSVLYIARDITESKLAEEALKNSEHLLRESQKVANIGSYVMDIASGTWECSKFLDELFGIDNKFTKDVSGWLQIVHPEDRAMMQKYFAENVLTKHESFNKEYRIRRLSDKLERWVHGMGELEFDDKEKPVKMIGTIQDITERKQAEKELLKLTTAVEQSANAIVISDIEGHIEYTNPKFTELTGYTAEEALGQNPRILNAGTQAKDYYAEMWQTISEGKTWEGEFHNKTKNGDLFWEHVIISPIKSKDGKITNYLAVKENITDKKEAAQALKDSEERFKQLSNLTFEGVLIHDKGLAIDLNLSFARIFGYEREELLGKNVIDLIVPKKYHEIIFENIAKDYAQPYEVLGTKKEGQIFPIEIESKRIKIDNNKTVRVTAIRDITERKKTQRQLIAAKEKAEESDRLKSTFLATMSHELRTPLNAIIGFSDIIDENVPIEEIISFSKTINSSGNHLLSIVEDLFDITLIESGESRILKSDESLHSILNDVYKIIETEQQKTNKDNLNLSLIIPPEGKDLTINTDSSKLKQILINLLKNALKFTDKGHVYYGYNIEKDQGKLMLKFYVEDTGIGIPKNKRELIFDVFRQLEDSNTRIYGGTGIGLSISKKLTELLGGKIWLKSKENEGTIFYFTIPLGEQIVIDEKEIKSVTKTKTKEKDKQKAKTVLIVEDVEASYEFLKIVLEKLEINTLWAKDGKESIKLCKENTDIDLVLMDINMPVMNGFEATQRIKKFRPNLPIIAQTAYAIVGDRQKSLDAGCDDYISKPIKQEELIGKIYRLLSSK